MYRFVNILSCSILALLIFIRFLTNTLLIRLFLLNFKSNFYAKYCYKILPDYNFSVKFDQFKCIKEVHVYSIDNKF